MQEDTNLIRLIKETEEELKSSPNNSQLWAYLADCYDKKFDFSKAIDCYNKSLEVDKDNFNVIQNLSAIYIDLNLYDNAVIHLFTALNLKKNNSKILRMLSECFYKLHKYHKAQFYGYRSVWANKWDFENWNTLGIAYWGGGDIEKAIKSLKIAISLNREACDIWSNLGFCLLEKDTKNPKATECFLTSISLNPLNSKSYFGLGNAFSYLKKYSEATSAYLKCLRYDKFHELALYNLFIALKEMKRNMSAERVWRIFLSRSSSSGSPKN